MITEGRSLIIVWFEAVWNVHTKALLQYLFTEEKNQERDEDRDGLGRLPPYNLCHLYKLLFSTHHCVHVHTRACAIIYFPPLHTPIYYICPSHLVVFAEALVGRVSPRAARNDKFVASFVESKMALWGRDRWSGRGP